MYAGREKKRSEILHSPDAECSRKSIIRRRVLSTRCRDKPSRNDARQKEQADCQRYSHETEAEGRVKIIILRQLDREGTKSCKHGATHDIHQGSAEELDRTLVAQKERFHNLIYWTFSYYNTLDLTNQIIVYNPIYPTKNRPIERFFVISVSKELLLCFLESNVLSEYLTELLELDFSLNLSLVLRSPIHFSCFLIFELYKSVL